MNYITRTRISKHKKKTKINIVIISVLVIFFLYIIVKLNLPIISSIPKFAFDKINKTYKTVAGVITYGTSYLDDVQVLKEELQTKELKINELEYKILENTILENENQSLKDKLDINDKFQYLELKYANIVTRDYNNWNETFVIDLGTQDLIEEKMMVISKDGLVGYISEVSEKNSVVKTIIDPNTSISVVISSTNSLALAKGDFSLINNNQIKVQYIPIEIEVKEEDTIYTSGIGEIYLKGIPIGKIVKIVNKKNEADRYAVVEPFVDFNNLSSVAVVNN